MKNIYWAGIAGIAGLAGVLLILFTGGLIGSQPKIPSASLVAGFSSPTGFQRAEEPLAWEFPDDFGPHPEYQTEWWYYTGNLESKSGERFGYQLTFFKRALLPEAQWIDRESAWAADQIFMGHFALSDIRAGKHYAFERFSRAGAGLAGAQSDPYQVWLENWQVTQTPEGKFQLTAEQDGIQIDLTLTDRKGPILHGEQGYSQKGPEKGNASHYYSQSRLETAGSVKTEDEIFQVSGLSWKDHEFSTRALASGQVGWDWFSLQLDDGSELMFFQIRREDGSIDPYSSGTLVKPNGDVVGLAREDFEIEVQDSWRSSESGAEYPALWRVEIPGIDLQLQIQPSLPDQEMNLSYTYWEGAVDATGTSNGESISGVGFVEMTGYASSFEGEF